MFSPFETILWDFDGVILDSMSIRDEGFRRVLNPYPDDQVEQLIDYHRINGGLSRYVKFRFFFEEIRGEGITEDDVHKLADQFSVYMLNTLKDPGLLIEDTMAFIQANHSRFNMHIVSGSDQDELRELCRSLQIDQFFDSIHGSPALKTDLVRQIMAMHKYNSERLVLVGDSVNDYDAAKANGLTFFGYNNDEIKGLGEGYIPAFKSLTSV
ncbi:MAG: HAD family hydrolase [Balneolaceae bacterium]